MFNDDIQQPDILKGKFGTLHANMWKRSNVFNSD